MTVEDNIPFRKTFKNNLLSEFRSMEVIEAANRKEGFKGPASYPVDLVFMDIKLPYPLAHEVHFLKLFRTRYGF